MPKRSKSATGEAWGILNPWGDVWTHDTFDTPDAAEKHLREFWRASSEADVSDFKIVRVKVCVTVAPTPSQERADSAGK